MEEGGAKSESNSIANQRELLRSFVKSQPDIRIFDIYVDDGYSGGNFDRPEFKRMTSDIEAGKVNCVIVKDLSRFGREYIEAGRWIEKTYPCLLYTSRSQSSRIIFLFTMVCITRSERNTRSSVQRKRRMRTVQWS